jgi:hypothetical protein
MELEGEKIPHIAIIIVDLCVRISIHLMSLCKEHHKSSVCHFCTSLPRLLKVQSEPSDTLISFLFSFLLSFVHLFLHSFVPSFLPFLLSLWY